MGLLLVGAASAVVRIVASFAILILSLALAFVASATLAGRIS